MYLHRRRDGTLSAWVTTSVSLANGTAVHQLSPTVGPAIEVAHALVAPGRIVYSRRVVEPELESLINQIEAMNP